MIIALKVLRRPPIGILAALLAACIALTATAQTSLQGQLTVRALSRDDIAAHGLPSTTELSGPLTTVGIGAPVYLEAQIPSSIPAAEIVNVSWAITSKPNASAAA